MTAPAVPPPAGTESPWLTPGEAAALLRVSVNTVIRWFHAGYIPGLREGSLYRLSAAFVQALLAAINAGQQVTISAFARQWAQRKAGALA